MVRPSQVVDEGADLWDIAAIFATSESHLKVCSFNCMVWCCKMKFLYCVHVCMYVRTIQQNSQLCSSPVYSFLIQILLSMESTPLCMHNIIAVGEAIWMAPLCRRNNVNAICSLVLLGNLQVQLLSLPLTHCLYCGLTVAGYTVCPSYEMCCFEMSPTQHLSVGSQSLNVTLRKTLSPFPIAHKVLSIARHPFCGSIAKFLGRRITFPSQCMQTVHCQVSYNII